MRELSLMVLWIGACGGSGGQPDAAVPPADAMECSLDDLVLEHLEGQTPVDCGTLLTKEDPARVAARDCVLAAIADGVAFRVIWEAGGDDAVEGRVRGAFVGVVRDDGLETQEMFYDGAPCGNPACGEVTLSQRCAELLEEDDCTSFLLAWHLCLDCRDPVGLDHCPPL